MLKTGYLEKVIKNGEPYLRLTGVGKNALVRDFPIFSTRRKKWDGKWRIVYYDIPEKDKNIRKQLREKLWELGFGMIQKSVYISPFDVAEDLREFLIAQGLGDSVFVSVAKGLFVGDVKILAEKVWRLERLNEEYFKLYQKLKKGGNFREIFLEYEDILRRDPCLPSELLPDDWMGDKVYLEIKNFLKKSKI
jgi:phenylacetic acid degradation operon negative regulatory protein